MLRKHQAHKENMSQEEIRFKLLTLEKYLFVSENKTHQG